MLRDDPASKSGAILTAERRPLPAELKALLNSVLDRPEAWMATPSIHFGGRAPAELVGTDEEAKIFDILHAVDLGLF